MIIAYCPAERSLKDARRRVDFMGVYDFDVGWRQVSAGHRGRYFITCWWQRRYLNICTDDAGCLKQSARILLLMSAVGHDHAINARKRRLMLDEGVADAFLADAHRRQFCDDLIAGIYHSAVGIRGRVMPHSGRHHSPSQAKSRIMSSRHRLPRQ